MTKIIKRERTESGILKYTVEYDMFTYTEGVIKQKTTFYACNRFEMKTKIDDFKNSINRFSRVINNGARVLTI